MQYNEFSHIQHSVNESHASPITTVLRCPLSPPVFQPAAIGRYVPFAVFLSFHENHSTREKMWHEHVSLIRGKGGPNGNINTKFYDSSDTDTDSDGDDDEEVAGRDDNESPNYKLESSYAKYLVKLTTLDFKFEAFSNSVDNAIRELNSTVWYGGDDNLEEHVGQEKIELALASDLPSWISREMMTFICLPLLGDAFSVQTVISVFELIGIGKKGLGLNLTLTMVMLFLESQPVSLLYQHMVSKPLQASPVQRWLRDSLLQFQVYMASDVEDEENIVENLQPGESSGKHSVKNSFADIARRYHMKRNQKNLMCLMTDVISSRTVHEVDADSGSKSEANRGSDVSFESSLLTKQSIPSLDEIVRHILRPAWLFVRRSYHLEMSMMLVALVLEVLLGISDQLEKRSYGEMTLQGTIRAWQVVAKQLRVSLLLASRAGGRVCIDDLGDGIISLYSLLASDTLCFAIQPEQAVEHELRCQEVYNRRANKDDENGKNTLSGKNSDETSSVGGNGGALLAWGISADTRWKELVGIADMEDAVFKEATVATRLMSATSALMTELNHVSLRLSTVLSTADGSGTVTLPSPVPSPTAMNFPLSVSTSVSVRNSTPSPTAASSPSSPANTSRKQSVSVAKEHRKVRRRRPLLLFFPTHNQPVPLASYRSCALAERWKRRPKRLENLALAGAHLFPVPAVTRAAVAEHILTTTVFPLIKEYIQIEEGSGQQQKTFSNTSISPVSSVAQGTSMVSNSPQMSGMVPLRPTEIQELVVVMAEAKMSEQFVRACIELLSATLKTIEGSNHSHEEHSEMLSSDVYRRRSNTTSTTHQTPYNRMSLRAAEDEEDELKCWPGIQDEKLRSLVCDYCQRGGTHDMAVRQHMAFLRVLQLRTQCGLRGVKLSQLYGSSLHDSLVNRDSLSNAENSPASTSVTPENKSSFGVSSQTKRLREEFLLQCFRRLGSQPCNVVYSIAETWGFEGRAIRLGHLQIVIQTGLDDVAEGLIGQIDDSTSVMDCVIQGVRHRVGTCLATMERLQACGPLLASFDPDSYSWSREASGPPDHVELEEVKKGRRQLVPFDVPASRHLLIRVQALLLLVGYVTDLLLELIFIYFLMQGTNESTTRSMEEAQERM